MHSHPTTASSAVDTAVHQVDHLSQHPSQRSCWPGFRRHGVCRGCTTSPRPESSAFATSRATRQCVAASGRCGGTRSVTSGADSSLPDRATKADAADAPDAVHAVDTRNAAHAPRAVHTAQSAHAPLKANAENGQHAGHNPNASAGAGAPSDRNAAGCGRASSHSDTAGRGRASGNADAAGRRDAPGHRDTVRRIHAARDSDTVGGPDAADRGDRAGSGRRAGGVLLVLSASFLTGHGWHGARARFQRPHIDEAGGTLGRSCCGRCSARGRRRAAAARPPNPAG